MVRLSIIIVSWNTKELLKQCLESIIHNANPKILTEVVVVDNGSRDGSIGMMKRLIDGNSREFAKICDDSCEIKLIENKENLGFTKANNQGIKIAKGEYIMLLNSDTIVKPGAIERLLTELSDRKEISIIGPRLLNADGTPQPNCGKFPSLPVVAVMLFLEHFCGGKYVRCSPAKSCFVDWLMGAAFVARKEVFDKIGGLDENIFMYMEEVEWFYRASMAGFKTYFLKEAEIVHLGRGSSKSGKTEPILNIYRGIIYFYKRHKSKSELVILRMLLRLKAFATLSLGYLKNDSYLKETYGQALKIH